MEWLDGTHLTSLALRIVCLVFAVGYMIAYQVPKLRNDPSTEYALRFGILVFVFTGIAVQLMVICKM